MGAFIAISVMMCLGLVYWWATVHEKKRREKLITMAQSLGLEISWELAPADMERFKRFEIATKGRRQNVNMVLCADTGETRLVVFDYEYVKGQGKNRIERIFSVALCTDSRLKAPKLSLSPESWGTNIAAFVGARDINFNEDPEFSKAFQLLGNDEDSVRRFMNRSRREALLAHPRIKLEVDGDALLVMQPHIRLDAESVRTYMSQALTANQLMIGESK
jgi:hypothetical protein